MTELTSRSPWNWSQVVWQGNESTAPEVDEAVVAAQRSFAAWSLDTGRLDRIRDFAKILARRRGDIVELLILEAGKVRADAEAEADLLVKKIEVTLNDGLRRIAPAVTTPGTAPRTVARPRGVAAILGPYNFPLHLLHGLVVPALAVGCTVVAKASEHCLKLGELYFECLYETRLSEVCRILRGGHAVAKRMVLHPSIATVAAVGGRAMGLALSKQLAQRPEVVLALELGGVNPAIILDDADAKAAVEHIADGAWKMAGQRCTATRIAHVPRAQLSSYLKELSGARQRWLPAADANGAVGPMISPDAREKFQAAFKKLPTGIELVAGDPNAANADPLLLAVRNSAVRTSELITEEHFGPALIVDAYDDLDDCLARCAANPYRLAASVFTASAERFQRCALALPYGQVNHNRPTAGARSDFPFGGLGLSGNGRPAAVAACAIFVDECVVM
jgi:succinylglutamic semialdehyde dehydrogenase